mmetsp:Transcript_12491/g.29503  ORF Transcript_12491/g.29503 Transcript_12491/m.29503 type:complete len:234 (-) Transcript_12491:1391-2092(-)
MLVLHAVLHCLFHCVEEPLVTNEPLQPSFAESLLHAVPHHRKGDLQAPHAEVVHHVLDDMDSGSVNADHRRHLQDHVLGLVHLLQVIDMGQKHVLHKGGIGKVEGGANACNEDILDEGARTLLLHISVDGCPRDAPKDGDLWARGLVDHDDQGQADRHHDPHQHSQEERPDESGAPQDEVVLLHVEEVPGLSKGNQRNDGVHDNRCQGELGQVVEQGRQEHQCAKHHHGRDDP